MRVDSKADAETAFVEQKTPFIWGKTRTTQIAPHWKKTRVNSKPEPESQTDRQTREAEEPRSRGDRVQGEQESSVAQGITGMQRTSWTCRINISLSLHITRIVDRIFIIHNHSYLSILQSVTVDETECSFKTGAGSIRHQWDYIENYKSGVVFYYSFNETSNIVNGEMTVRFSLLSLPFGY